jgi:hypothetical protein
VFAAFEVTEREIAGRLKVHPAVSDALFRLDTAAPAIVTNSPTLFPAPPANFPTIEVSDAHELASE